MSEKTDEAYMLDFQKGDPSAMAVLFERYKKPMYNYLLKVSGDAAATEELTQQLFIRILRFRMSYKPGNFKAWVYRMATNLAADHFRVQAKKRDHQLPLGEKHEEYVEDRNDFSEGDYKTLDRALLSLDDEQRELILLSKYHGMRYEEIASILDLSVSNVKVRVHRAMIQLRKNYFNPTL